MKKQGRKLKSSKVKASDGSGSRPSPRVLLPFLCMVGLLAGAVYGLEHLKRYVYSLPEYHPSSIRVTLLDPPDWVQREQWGLRILSAVEVPDAETWMDERLPIRVAQQLTDSGWVRQVKQVTRQMDGTIEVACSYRRPIAMLSTEAGYVPVDADGFRLPEIYEQVGANSGWLRIRGIQSAMPKVNQPFQGEDALAAIELASVIFEQGWDMSSQISVIDMANFRGRRNRRESHIKLHTPQGHLIHWGSAIGEEIEEPTAAEKLANIAMMLKRGGPQAQVDVSVFPDAAVLPIPIASTIKTADSANRHHDR